MLDRDNAVDSLLGGYPRHLYVRIFYHCLCCRSYHGDGVLVQAIQSDTSIAGYRRVI